MYKVIKLFTDLQDGGHKYEEGDTYPRKGLKPTEDRIAELMSPDNKQGVPLIEEIVEEEIIEEAPKKKGRKVSK